MATTTRPKLAAHQSDLLLDVLEVCRSVRDLYDLKSTAEQSGSDEDVRDLTARYDAAVEKAASVYGEAVAYVPKDLLEQVANNYLPEHLMVDGFTG